MLEFSSYLKYLKVAGTFLTEYHAKRKHDYAVVGYDRFPNKRCIEMFLLKVGGKNDERLPECLRNGNLLQYGLAVVLTENSFPIFVKRKHKRRYFLVPLVNETSRVLKQQIHLSRKHTSTNTKTRLYSQSPNLCEITCKILPRFRAC